MSEQLRLLVIGAHPDDADIAAGGVASLYREQNHTVKFVSVTNGQSGHHQIPTEEMKEIRKAEANASAKVLGIEYEVLNFPDGYLQPTLEARAEIIAIIRSFQPDLVLTHRPNDYHPDHRVTSQLVCDAAYLVTVPHIVPNVPALRTDPVIAYLADDFTRPYPFSPRVVVDIEPVLDKIVDMLDCHQSQFYDWIPYNRQIEAEVPVESAARRAWLKSWYLKRIEPLADRYRNLLIQTYGAQQGNAIRYIEAFEPCEYGALLTDDNLKRLFPFFT